MCIRDRLCVTGKPDVGSRGVLNKRLHECSQEEDRSEQLEEEMRAHASDSPLIVMVDESIGNKYMRSVDHKGLGEDGDNRWLVKDMHQELKSWATREQGRMARSSRVTGSQRWWL